MSQRNILWVSRHALWSTQIELLHSLHGKKCHIQSQDLRFDSFAHLVDFLEQHKDTNYVYLVVPEDWKETARELGYSFGVVHRPMTTKDQGKKKRMFSIEYYAGATVAQTRQKGKSYGTKGFHRKRRKNSK